MSFTPKSLFETAHPIDYADESPMCERGATCVPSWLSAMFPGATTLSSQPASEKPLWRCRNCDGLTFEGESAVKCGHCGSHHVEPEKR